MGSRVGVPPQALESQERGSSSSSAAATRCALVLATCALVVSLAVLAVTLVKEQEPRPERRRGAAPNSSTTSPSPEPLNAAQLILNPDGMSRITDRKLSWLIGTSTKGAYLGSAFEYNNSELMVKVPGQYCIYAQVNVRRHHKNSKKEVNASLIVHHKSAGSSESSKILTIDLELSLTSNETVQRFQAVSDQLASNDTLHVTIEASSDVEHHWALSEHGNFFGLFQILDS